MISIQIIINSSILFYFVCSLYMNIFMRFFRSLRRVIIISDCCTHHTTVVVDDHSNEKNIGNTDIENEKIQTTLV